MKLSVVTSLYRSAPFIAEFHARMRAAAQAFADDEYEIILVNDGSPDNSLELAVDLAGRDPHVVVVDLSRNFGQHKALMTGLRHAEGDRVFLLDVDLEEEPEWLESFAGQMEQEGCDVVYGVQARRKGGWFERWSGNCFYTLLNRLAGLDMPKNMTTARLMTRRYVLALAAHEETEVYIDGLFYITGFAQSAQRVVKRSRGTTTYTLRKKIALMINSVTAFSNAPLVGIFYVGLIIFLPALGYIAYAVIGQLVFDYFMTGWASLIASIWLLGGMMICFLGLIGIYLSKVFSETKRRPYTIVRQVYGRK
jgi:putative glycosyltransferase